MLPRTLPLPLCLLLLLLTAITPSSTSASLLPIPKALHKRTSDFRRDLRLAFRGIRNVNRDVQTPLIRTSAVCVVKSGASGLTGGGSSSSSGGSGSGNATTSGAPSGLGGNATESGSAVPVPVSVSSSSSITTRTTASAPVSTPTPTSKAASSPSSAPSPSSPWNLVQSYQGTNFFNGWDFTTGVDSTTGGIVTYVDENTARSANILSINAQGNAIMAVETTPTVPSTRQSIRITTQASFTGGLVLMDSVHMPTGCGTWPAFWTDGPGWPAGGEIDIIEGVDDYTANQATLHTTAGCTLASTNPSALNITGTLVDSTDCNVATTANAGCGIRATASGTYGPGFNSGGGGVYAMQWDTTGIQVYFFPRTGIPSDITSGTPQPSSWAASNRMASWPASTCNPFQFFNSHSAIFDTTLCGVWTDSVWNVAGQAPGQDQSCAQRTGFSTCEAFVQASGSSFEQAYWEVSYVKIYQLSS